MKTTKTNRKVINGLYDELANALLTLLRHEALRIDASRAPNAAQGARAGQKKREDVFLGAPKHAYTCGAPASKSHSLPGLPPES